MNKVASSCATQVPNSINLSANSSIKSHQQPRNQHIRLLKNCNHLIQFKQIHAQIIKTSIDQSDTQLAKLVESLVASAQVDYARIVFNQIAEPSTFAFNNMVRGYAANGSGNEGIEVYIQMKYRGLEPDNYTYPFLLKACSDLNQGKGVHSLVLKNQKFSSEIHSQTSLLHFYCSHDDIESARLLFDGMSDRNVVTWTAMISGYVKQKRYKEGLSLFHQMQMDGIEMNELTLVSVLSACAHLGAFEMGKWVHQYVNKNRIFMNPTLTTALIDMYVKCGFIEIASWVFQRMPVKSVCTWNSIIGGLAMHGYGEEALERFEQMRMNGIKADDITLIGVLSACTHSGLVEKGKKYFYSMRRDYDIEPNIKHYGCLVDLLCRAGHLYEAYDIMRKMPMKPNGVLWGTLLNACGTKANVELAQIAMERLIELEPFNDGNYVLMSNIYAAKGLWDNVAKTRKFMKDERIVKNPGCSLIEVNNVVHRFMVGDSRHPCSEQIYSMLEDVTVSLREEGYVPKIN